MKAESPAVHAGVGYQVELVCVVYSEPAADVLWYKVRKTFSFIQKCVLLVFLKFLKLIYHETRTTRWPIWSRNAVC